MWWQKLLRKLRTITGYTSVFLTIVAILFGIGGVSIQFWNLFDADKLDEAFLQLGQWAFYLIIVIGLYQYEKDTRFKRREAVLREVPKILGDTLQYKVNLNEKVDFSSYSESEKPIGVAKIHEWICIPDGQGGYKRSHNDPDAPYEMSADGRKIQSLIKSIINSYETLSIGVFYGIFDEETSKEMFRGIILKNWNLFKEYIEHRRGERHKEEKFAIYFEELYERWRDRKRSASKVSN